MLPRLKRALLLALCIAMLAPMQPGYAATNKQKALKAYNKMLSGGTVYILPKGVRYRSYTSGGTQKYTGTKSAKVRFSLAYIDGDSIPELVLCDNEYRFGFFSYRNGKVVRQYYDTWWNVGVQYYRNRSLFVTRRVPNAGISAVKYNGYTAGKYAVILAVYQYKTGPKHCSDHTLGQKAKSITIESFRTKLAAHTAGAKPSKITYRANTKRNRGRYLK